MGIEVFAGKIYGVGPLSVEFEVLRQKSRGDGAYSSPVVFTVEMALEFCFSILRGLADSGFVNFYLRTGQFKFFYVDCFLKRVQLDVEGGVDTFLAERFFPRGGQFQIFDAG